jgi:hypothetical protein
MIVGLTPRLRALFLFGLLFVIPFGCAQTGGVSQNEADLRRQNRELLAEIARLQDAARNDQPPPQTPIRSLTVGIAATEQSFDSQAFVALLSASLEDSASTSDYRVQQETDDRQIAKVRGMLIQQYLAAEEIPITVRNLRYKVRKADSEFRIGGSLVPRSGVQIASAGGGGAPVFLEHPEPIGATLARDGRGRYTIEYEEMDGGKGRIPIPVEDVELLDAEQPPRSARQGDISLNWSLNLAKFLVYRVENFQGDGGKFLRNMRYPGAASAISRYQTIRDVVFLIGYGNYQTGLVNQIRTPAYISEVLVRPIDARTFAQLQGGISLEEIEGLLGRETGWIPCEFVNFAGEDRIWERPRTVGFPFVSRQGSTDKGLVFYTKYDTQGAALIGDFEIGQ